MAADSDWIGATLRYLLFSLLGHSAWEVLQLPLYTILKTGTLHEQIFAIALYRWRCDDRRWMLICGMVDLWPPDLATDSVWPGCHHDNRSRRHLHGIQRVAQCCCSRRVGLLVVDASLAFWQFEYWPFACGAVDRRSGDLVPGCTIQQAHVLIHAVPIKSTLSATATHCQSR